MVPLLILVKHQHRVFAQHLQFQEQPFLTLEIQNSEIRMNNFGKLNPFSFVDIFPELRFFGCMLDIENLLLSQSPPPFLLRFLVRTTNFDTKEGKPVNISEKEGEAPP